MSLLGAAVRSLGHCNRSVHRIAGRKMATVADSTHPVSLTAEGAVSISYPTLVKSPSTLTSAIEKAFGSHPDSLGIIVIRDLPPAFVNARERLLTLAYQFANLEVNVRERYADPKTKYSFGWSHGKEIMNGRPDTLKGSYYANPVVDTPNVPADQRAAYPEYYGTNIWPSNDIEGIDGFESAFKTLGRLIFAIGCDLATACQPFGKAPCWCVYTSETAADLHTASSHLVDSSVSLADLIRSSQTTKARLLHYFPPSPDAPLPAADEPIDSWCGFHLDHSLLTGLCSAMFLRPGPNGEPTAVPSPSPTSGLYIRTRGGALTKVSIPPDCLAFQTGEALELATAGSLRATPHCVRVGASADMEDVSRETFALFMQPNTDQQIAVSETFGQFSKRVFDRHYKQEQSAGM
ncbi:Clavaminate synthase-like protein [Wolfiporia cocos MD-104 SS10]|uniref:Clavaminate synthase-like protein n=1 Tax=Wolfiporia cocos (strain MD-104) TaxID=742152 RepID=A0A2H3IUG0_WOLCO|nr:Clavaminate synthase-like protein [Wolfiporia cocos MD-104 SS10]